FWYTIFDLRPEHGSVVEEVVKLPESYESVVQHPDGRYIMDMLDAQDVMAWVTQGPIADRTNEKLCASDRGVLMFRSLLEQQIEAAERGEPLMNVFDLDDAPGT